MQNSDLQHAKAAYDAAQQDLLDGNWSLDGIAPGELEAAEVWERMSRPDSAGDTPVDRIRKSATTIKAVTNPVTYRIVWDREAARLESEFGITRDMAELDLERLLKTPLGAQLVPSRYIKAREKKKYTLYQWVVRYCVRQFIRENMQNRVYNGPTPERTLTDPGKAVFRESLVRTAPHLTIFNPNENLNWINHVDRKDARKKLRDLMGDSIPDDDGDNGKIEATAEMVALLAYLRKMPSLISAPTAPDTRFEELYNDVLGGDVTKAEKRLESVSKIYEPFKKFRDEEKRKFDHTAKEKERKLSEKEAALKKYQPAADAIVAIIEVEEERFTKKKQIGEIDTRVTDMRTRITDLEADIQAKASAAASAAPAPSTPATPTVASSPAPDQRQNLVTQEQQRIDQLQTARDNAHSTRSQQQLTLKKRIAATKGAITKGKNDGKPADWIQEREDRIQDFERQIVQMEQEEATEVRVFEEAVAQARSTIQTLERDMAANPPPPTPVIVVSTPASPPMAPMAPMADPRETRLQAMQKQLQELEAEQRKAVTDLGSLTAKSRRLRTTYATAYSQQINDTDITVKNLFNVVLINPLDIDPISTQSAWDAAITTLSDAPGKLMKEHTTRVAAWEIDKRAHDTDKERDKREFDDRFDPTRAFEKFVDRATSNGTTIPHDFPDDPEVTKATLKDGDFLNFKQLEDEYNEATLAVRKAKADRQARGGKDTKYLSPIDTLRRLHMTDPEYIKKFGDPDERAFRSMVSSLLMVNMVRNRAVYARRARRLAEQAATPTGVTAWFREKYDYVKGKTPRSFDDYRIDHLQTNPKFKKLKTLRLNTTIDELAGWIGDDDKATLTLESLRELMDEHIRPLALDAKKGARLALKDSVKIVALLERMEAVYYTALVRKKMKVEGAPKDKADLFATMLGDQLSADISTDPGAFMTVSESMSDRAIRQPLPDDEEDEKGTDIAKKTDSVFSADRLLSLATTALTNWFMHRDKKSKSND